MYFSSNYERFHTHRIVLIIVLQCCCFKPKTFKRQTFTRYHVLRGWLRSTAVERRNFAGELFLSHAF